MDSLKYKLVLGLEIHLHLKTKTKMFCGCDADIYGKEPNTHTCPTCLGLPGALPMANFDAVQKAQLLGLALNCKLNNNSRFDRKHYFYPDLPKGYQISQYKQPLCEHGNLVLDSGNKVEVERVHLEEDVAKSFHENDKTLIDFNKSGIPLVEIVTTPCFKTVEDAVEFSKKVQDIVRYLAISGADMEKGQMRLEANISLRTEEMERGGKLPNYKVEVKNINSFRFMEKAVKAEIKRQSAMLEGGKIPVQENRGYDEDLDETVSQREKEEAHDYRYFPEPDIPPMVFDDDYINDLKKKIPELPWQRKDRLVKKYGISEASADLLSLGDSIELCLKFEEIISKGLDPVKVSNLLLNKLEFKNLSVEDFIEKFKETETPYLDKTLVEEVVSRIIKENLGVVESYKKGKISALEFLVGQAMRETKGKADASTVRNLLLSQLN